MKVPVTFLTFEPTQSGRGHGDQQFLEAIFADKMPAENHYEIMDWRNLKHEKGGVVIMPLAHNAPYIDKVNKYLFNLEWVLLCLTSNEESNQAYRDIKHPNMKIWLQTPSAEDQADAYLFEGYPTYVHNYTSDTEIFERPTDFFFEGQATPRRQEWIDAVKDLPNGLVVCTGGFGQGEEYQTYINHFLNAKIALCPGGTVSPDTFRLYEALECGCIPILDTQGFSRDWGEGGIDISGKNYWDKVFSTPPPFPMVRDIQEIPELVRGTLEHYEKMLKDTREWWVKEQVAFVMNFESDIRYLARELRK